MNSNKPDKVIERISIESRVMNAFLNKQAVTPAIKERLQDQLSWLKHQITHHEKRFDMLDLADRYDWVVENFNTTLDLPDEERFNYFSELDLEAV